MLLALYPSRGTGLLKEIRKETAMDRIYQSAGAVPKSLQELAAERLMNTISTSKFSKSKF